MWKGLITELKQHGKIWNFSREHSSENPIITRNILLLIREWFESRSITLILRWVTKCWKSPENGTKMWNMFSFFYKAIAQVTSSLGRGRFSSWVRGGSDLAKSFILTIHWITSRCTMTDNRACPTWKKRKIRFFPSGNTCVSEVTCQPRMFWPRGLGIKIHHLDAAVGYQFFYWKSWKRLRGWEPWGQHSVFLSVRVSSPLVRRRIVTELVEVCYQKHDVNGALWYQYMENRLLKEHV